MVEIKNTDQKIKPIKNWQEFLEEKYPHHSQCPHVSYETIFWDYLSTLPDDFTDYESVGVPSEIYEEAMFKSTVGGHSI